MFEDMTYEVILKRMLDRVKNSIDKREGSIIYDALAPAAVELSIMYDELDTSLCRYSYKGISYKKGCGKRTCSLSFLLCGAESRIYSK